MKQSNTINSHVLPKLITRCIWALCVLDTPDKIVKPLNSLINNFLFHEENTFYELNKSDISVLYYSYLYLQNNSKIFSSSLTAMIHTVYSQQVLKCKHPPPPFKNWFPLSLFKEKKNISMLCMEVHKYLNSMKIPNRLELNVDNILVDI